ncbi:hypothetical protein SAMN04487944_104108 [Gracilibacillus ureilyticus]|uniref:Uncharacterized protein n=1 Tax=Gracilibacillus ureilyticus TaxID=531814 RepID=A0A1H9P5V0_9BACI|nr:hypothetical protein [Gracilibacillus ureilyticus]SER43467.1 hypothetical protein SAMN04487944_104108 [Gracilibacillus ureilyticus]
MKQAGYGLTLYIILILPPVSELLESMMVFHMHTQMPLFVFSGFLIAPFLQRKFPNFFNKWNRTGIPGLLLVVLIWTYWQLPRAMDDALLLTMVELFKFISLPFLVGVPLHDSWKKVNAKVQYSFLIYIFLSLIITGFLYIWLDEQICNNYLVIEQQTLGWSSLAMGFCLLLYLSMKLFGKENTM